MKENSIRSDGDLWIASCSLKAIAAILVAVNVDEFELDDEGFLGLGKILLSIASDIDRAREKETLPE